MEKSNQIKKWNMNKYGATNTRYQKIKMLHKNYCSLAALLADQLAKKVIKLNNTVNVIITDS